MPQAELPAVDTSEEIEGLKETLALAWGWFFEKGQFEYMQLSLEEQVSFAATYGHLDTDGFVRALKFLSSLCEVRRRSLLDCHLTAGNA